jgi:hypothetical protein
VRVRELYIFKGYAVSQMAESDAALCGILHVWPTAFGSEAVTEAVGAGAGAFCAAASPSAGADALVAMVPGC